MWHYLNIHTNINYLDAMHLTVPKSPGPDNRASFSCGGSESKIGLCVPILQQDLCSQHGDAGVICLGKYLHIFSVTSKFCYNSEKAFL